MRQLAGRRTAIHFFIYSNSRRNIWRGQYRLTFDDDQKVHEAAVRAVHKDPPYDDE
jgi:hypothetical protein